MRKITVVDLKRSFCARLQIANVKNQANDKNTSLYICMNVYTFRSRNSFLFVFLLQNREGSRKKGHHSTKSVGLRALVSIYFISNLYSSAEIFICHDNSSRFQSLIFLIKIRLVAYHALIAFPFLSLILSFFTLFHFIYSNPLWHFYLDCRNSSR